MELLGVSTYKKDIYLMAEAYYIDQAKRLEREKQRDMAARCNLPPRGKSLSGKGRRD